MKKTIIYILLSALVFLSAQGLFSCRVIEKMSMHADSSATRSEQSTEKWNREVIREYLPGETDTDTIHSFHEVKVPQYITIPGKSTIIRETIRDQGEKTSNLAEEIKTMLSQQNVSKEPAGWIPWVILGIAALVLLTFFLTVVHVLKK